MESKWHNAPRCCIKEIFHLLLSWVHGGILLLKTFWSRVFHWQVKCPVFLTMILIYRETVCCLSHRHTSDLFLSGKTRVMVYFETCKCMQSLSRVRINSRVSTKPYIRVQHSMDQFKSCSSTKLLQQGEPGGSQKKGYTRLCPRQCADDMHKIQNH